MRDRLTLRAALALAAAVALTPIATASAQAPPPAPPANDAFSAATVIAATGGTVTGTNVQATAEGGELPPDGVTGGHSVWWRITPTSTGPMTVSTAGSAFDTSLQVSTGAAVNALTKVKGNDDVLSANTTSKVVVWATKGTIYQIAIDGFNGATGAIQLTVTAPTPMLTVTAPNGGETVTRGAPRSVTWTYSYPGAADPAAPAAPPAPATPPGVKQIDALLAKAGAGRVRAIVGLNVATAPEGSMAPAAAANQQSQISGAQVGLATRLASSGAELVRNFTSIPYATWDLTAAALELLRDDAEVASVGEDLFSTATLADSTPIVDADAAAARGLDGTNQTVAVLDTGVKSAHATFGGRVVASDCFASGNFCPNGASVQHGAPGGEPCTFDPPRCLHGTHVASIATGQGGDGTSAGVARGAPIHAVQIFQLATNPVCVAAYGVPSCALTTTNDQIAGLERIYHQASTNVRPYASVNMSLGGGQFTSFCDADASYAPIKAVVDNLRSIGVATVMASGNDGYKNAIGGPACISTAISVGSVNKEDHFSSFSNTYPALRLVAPGEAIMGANVPSGAHPLSGTSMATPQVAGAWAVLKEKAPTASVASVLSAFTQTGRAVVDDRTGGAGGTFKRIQVRAAAEVLGPRVTVEAIGPTTVTIATNIPVNNNGSALNPSGNGQVTWTVPADLTPGSYKVRVRSTIDSTIVDESNATFTVPGSGGGGPGTRAKEGDFDGVAGRDRAYFRPSTTRWHTRPDSVGVAWGLASDTRVPADYDGDGDVDIAVWRSTTGRWFLYPSGSGIAWGQTGDIPVPADYDGDGDADIAVWRPSNGVWYVRDISATQFGTQGDVPVPSFYDAGATADIAVWRPSTGTWFIKGQLTLKYGTDGDKPVPADYNGDGLSELALWRPTNGTWYIRNVATIQWGAATDRLVPGDYDNDGAVDLGVWRPSDGRWYVYGQASVTWGTATDIPVPVRN